MKRSGVGNPTSSNSLVIGGFDNGIFQPRYQRNNKRGGLKNLRCFPTCGIRHKERGFCGRSVVVKIRHTPGMGGETGLMCWAEFIKCTGTDPNSSSLRVGDKASYAQVLGLERTKDEPTKPWIRGELMRDQCSKDTTFFEFNKEKRGWHYGWASNKHTCNAEHCLQAYVFERVAPDSDDLICREIFKSPKFMLFCRRRRRFTVEPSAPIAPPLKKAKADSKQQKMKGGLGNAQQRKQLKAEESLSTKSFLFDGFGNIKVERNEGVMQGSPSPSSSGNNSNYHIDDQKLDGVMKLLLPIMTKLHNQQQQQQPSSKRPAAGNGGAPENGDDEFTAWMAETLGTITGNTTGDGDYVDPIVDAADNLDAELSGVAHASQIKALGMYLLEEKSFKSGVEELMRKSRNGIPDYTKFLRLVRSYVERYGRRKGITAKDMDIILSIDDETTAVPPSSGMPLQKTNPQDDHQLDVFDDLFTNEKKPSNHHYINKQPQYHKTNKHNNSKNNSSGMPRLFGSALGVLSSFVSSSGDDVNNDNYDVSFDSIFKDDDHYDITNDNHDLEELAKSLGHVGGDGGKASHFNLVDSIQRARSPITIGGGPGNVPIPNIQGRWRRTQESEQFMQDMRTKCGTPWVLSKMFEFMESKFEIYQQGINLTYKLSRSFLSNTSLVFKLDGEEHPWGIKTGPFSQLAQGWTYRAWVEGSAIMLSHTIGEQRVMRIMWCSEDRLRLLSTVIFEVMDRSSHTFKEAMRVKQEAVRLEDVVISDSVLLERERFQYDNNASASTSKVSSSSHSAFVGGLSGSRNAHFQSSNHSSSGYTLDTFALRERERERAERESLET